MTDALVTFAALMRERGIVGRFALCAWAEACARTSARCIETMFMERLPDDLRSTTLLFALKGREHVNDEIEQEIGERRQQIAHALASLTP